MTDLGVEGFPALVSRPGGVEVGTVNGLPCVRAVGEIVYDSLWEEIPYYSGPWMAGLPDWWPYPPTRRCPRCGFDNDEARERGILGHACPGVPADPGMVELFASVEAFTSPGWSRR